MHGEPFPCRLYAAGFNLGPARMLMDCPYTYDSQLHYLFFGEELSMAVRLYMAGYDMYVCMCLVKP
jgi:[Skp1-protein]-hydroxyproline N-acetylglucosaminyltransferase